MRCSETADIFAEFESLSIVFGWRDQTCIDTLDLYVLRNEVWQASQQITHKSSVALTLQDHERFVIAFQIAESIAKLPSRASLFQAAEVSGQNRDVVRKINNPPQRLGVQRRPGFGFASEIGPRDGANENTVAGEKILVIENQ